MLASKKLPKVFYQASLEPGHATDASTRPVESSSPPAKSKHLAHPYYNIGRAGVRTETPPPGTVFASLRQPMDQEIVVSPAGLSQYTHSLK